MSSRGRGGRGRWPGGRGGGRGGRPTVADIVGGTMEELGLKHTDLENVSTKINE